MWKEITNPDLLIYLDVSFEISMKRKNLNWSIEEFDEQIKRLDDAHNHADLIINTDKLSPDEVYCIVVEFMNQAL
jgi:thymidylate kinase